MKTIFAVLMFMMMGSMVSAAPVAVQAPIKRVYAPQGFDSNDVVQFVVEGYFPNSCYRPGFVGATVRQNEHVIEVSSQAFRYSGICLEVIIPYDQVITVGTLGPGTYRIVQAGSRAQLSALPIRASISDDPDDFMYAPISQALFQERGGGSGEVLLKGEFPLSCMVFDRIDVAVEPSAIVVQPIVKLDPNQTCVKGSYPFQRSVGVRGAPGRYVLHVRSMNGKAINSLVDIR